MSKLREVTAILKDAHDKMIRRYIVEEDIQNDVNKAQVITNFLQAVKIRSNNPNGLAQDLVDEAIRTQIDDIVKGLRGSGSGSKNLFRGIGANNDAQGKMLEKDLGAIFAAFIRKNTTSPKEKKKVITKKFTLGQDSGKTADSSDITSDLKNDMDEIVKGYVKEAEQKIQSQKPVMGKIDTIIDGSMINITADMDEHIQELLKALKDATFTDKNYASNEIHLGDSDPFRSIYGALKGLGFDTKNILHVYYGGENIIKGIDNRDRKETPAEVKSHIYHLRYLYELTGIGIRYNKQQLNNKIAKFLIYNNPKTDDIVCISTKQIVAEQLKKMSVPQNPYKEITITKKSILDFARII